MIGKFTNIEVTAKLNYANDECKTAHAFTTRIVQIPRTATLSVSLIFRSIGDICRPCRSSNPSTFGNFPFPCTRVYIGVYLAWSSPFSSITLFVAINTISTSHYDVVCDLLRRYPFYSIRTGDFWIIYRRLNFSSVFSFFFIRFMWIKSVWCRCHCGWRDESSKLIFKYRPSSVVHRKPYGGVS